MATQESNTGTQIQVRRKLRFESIDEALRDLDAILAAHHQGKLHAQGNWTAGQILAHVANWIDYGYVGYPVKSPPWFVKFLLSFMLKNYLNKGMPSGVRIPGIPEGTTGMDQVDIDEGAERLRRSFLRLRSGEECSFDSPAFGKMSHEDRIRLNLRHAELHLSFLQIA